MDMEIHLVDIHSKVDVLDLLASDNKIPMRRCSTQEHLSQKLPNGVHQKPILNHKAISLPFQTNNGLDLDHLDDFCAGIALKVSSISC